MDYMAKIDTILSSTMEGTTFSLARFNDGEMMGVERPGSVVARGDQKVNEELSLKLKRGLQHRQENYWIGVPCPVCWKKHHDVAMKLVPKDYEYLTYAVVTTNRNWKRFVTEFPVAVKGKRVVWVSGRDQNLEALKEKTGIQVAEHIKVRCKNAWLDYSDVRWRVNNLQDGDIVVLSCGPLSRVLAKEWFQERRTCTYLDVGSAFDPFTRNVKWRCHTGQLPPCEGCN